MTAAWALMLVGLVLAVTPLLAAAGILRRNGLVGIRTRAVQRDQNAWKRGHASAARVLVPIGLLAAALGIGLVMNWLPFSTEHRQGVALGGVAVVAVATLLASRMANHAAGDTPQG